MDQLVATWQSANFRAARQQARERECADLGRSAVPVSSSSLKSIEPQKNTLSEAAEWAFHLPRLSRIIDVLIAAIVAYFAM